MNWIEKAQMEIVVRLLGVFLKLFIIACGYPEILYVAQKHGTSKVGFLLYMAVGILLWVAISVLNLAENMILKCIWPPATEANLPMQIEENRSSPHNHSESGDGSLTHYEID